MRSTRRSLRKKMRISAVRSIEVLMHGAGLRLGYVRAEEVSTNTVLRGDERGSQQGSCNSPSRQLPDNCHCFPLRFATSAQGLQDLLPNSVLRLPETAATHSDCVLATAFADPRPVDAA